MYPQITRPKIFIFGILLLIFTAGFWGWFKGNQSIAPNNFADSSLPVVYTSIYPLYDFTQKIGGENITLVNIIPLGNEPHSFEPSPQLITKLGNATLFLYNGAGMEPYLEKLLATLTAQPLLKIKASENIPTIKENGVSDPHFWLNPLMALSMGENILEALIQMDPAQQKTYEENFQIFARELTQLDQDYREILIKTTKPKIVVMHQAFNYLCQEYGLEQMALIGLQSEAEPTPGKIKEIIQLMQTENIKYLFTDSFSNPKIAETIARETGASILPLHSLGNLTSGELDDGKDYLQLMRENLHNLQTALGEK